MKLTFDVESKPKFGQLLVFAFQQLLAIMAATIVVPVIINGNAGLAGGDQMSQAAALFGAGVGTIVYLLFTKFKSPVFLGSSFAFLGSMTAAFAGASTVALGYIGLICGAVFAGLVYVIISVVVKFAGTRWIEKLMPAVVIGPTVAIIGLSLAGNAVGDLQTANAGGSVYVAIICGLVTLAVTMICSAFGKKMVKLIPFILGILAGYAVALVFTLIGNATNNPDLMVIDFTALKELFNIGTPTFVNVLGIIFDVPKFTFMKAFGAFGELSGEYIVSILIAYAPVAFVVFAEHIADHKNLSSIINRDLLKEPGLHRTLLGDGVGSMAGALFGGCPNTTYGESIGCVAITGNASVTTIVVTSILAILISFFKPFVAFLSTIPSCVMGGVCMALYGFIAVSGLKMVQKVDLEKNKNMFVVSVILIAGIGGLQLAFGKITITSIACALILGILTNLMLSKSDKSDDGEEKTEAETTETTESAETETQTTSEEK